MPYQDRGDRLLNVSMPRYIFITGGVVSSLGKGLGAAALASLLQARGYTVRLRKLDPYLNVDPGTMSPTQHGEVFVTCLLYTSPSPRDMRRSRMPSSA